MQTEIVSENDSRALEALMSTVAEKIYTPDDLLLLPDRKNYELVDGHLVERHMSVL
jgi:hypothetical protein